MYISIPIIILIIIIISAGEEARNVLMGIGLVILACWIIKWLFILALVLIGSL